MKDNTFGSTFEAYLTQFYLADSVCSQHVTEEKRREIYDELTKIFCITSDLKTEVYWKISNSAPFNSINDYVGYQRLCRIIQFSNETEGEQQLCEAELTVLSQKRNAMMKRESIFGDCTFVTTETMCTKLYSSSALGNVCAMSLLSFLEYHGICAYKDTERAIKRMKKCAAYNDLFSIMMCIRYLEDNGEYLDALYTLFKGEGQRQTFYDICREYGVDPHEREKNKLTSLMENAFSLGLISREKYDEAFMRAARCELISYNDKERLLLSKTKESLALLSELPLYFEHNGEVSVNKDVVKNVCLYRQAEQRKILQNVTVASRCSHEVCMPLLVASSEQFVSDMYFEMLKESIGEGQCFVIDADSLTPSDFSLTKDNVLLRGMCDTKAAHTVFLIKDCEGVSDGALAELKKLLDYGYRKKFKLLEPAITLDLSKVHFVLFAKERNEVVRSLSDVCEVVWTDNISSGEKESVARHVLASRCASFGCEEITADDELYEFLCTYSADKMKQIVDSALRGAIYDGETHLGVEYVKNICRENGLTRPKQVFGYAGGVVNA